MSMPHPVQQFFSIGEVCTLTDLKPHVLRYWESQFKFLSPAKNRSGNRVYKSREVELVMLVKHLLYTEKFTIEGARIRLDQYRRNGDLKSAARQAMRYETVVEVRQSLGDVLAVLDGNAIVSDVQPDIQPDVLPSAQPVAAADAPPASRHHGDEQLSLA